MGKRVGLRDRVAVDYSASTTHTCFSNGAATIRHAILAGRAATATTWTAGVCQANADAAAVLQALFRTWNGDEFTSIEGRRDVGASDNGQQSSEQDECLHGERLAIVGDLLKSKRATVATLTRMKAAWFD